MERIAIVDGVRTPFCKMGSDFHFMSAQELGQVVARELIERTGIDPAVIDEVVFGCVGQPADAANLARVIALMSGIPYQVPAYTVHRNCASGIEAVDQAVLKIKAGEGDCYLVGGAESMSNIPFYYSKKVVDVFGSLSRAKTIPAKLSAFMKLSLKELMSPQIGLKMGLTDPVCGMVMGLTAEVLAQEFGLTRKMQDEFSLESHNRALAARERLQEEIVPVIPSPKYKKAVEFDNGPREGQTIEALTKLKPYFDRKSGSVTVGNSSQVTDGAVALLVTTESKAKKLGLQPLGFVRATAFAGVEPHRMGIGPAHAIPKALKKANIKFEEVHSFEINEAFAVQVLACCKQMESEKFIKKNDFEGFCGAIDPKMLNVNGGAVALGHPVGSTGARLILTMLKHLNRNNLKTGVVSLCVGGGQGSAVVLETA